MSVAAAEIASTQHAAVKRVNEEFSAHNSPGPRRTNYIGALASIYRLIIILDNYAVHNGEGLDYHFY